MIIAGVLLALLSIAIRFIAIIQLKDNFSLYPFNAKYLVTSGLYKYIRHPMYLATIVLVTGLALIDEKIAIVYSIFLFFQDRALSEDAYNKRFYNYEQYYKNTGMFLPKIRRYKNDSSGTCT